MDSGFVIHPDPVASGVAIVAEDGNTEVKIAPIEADDGEEVILTNSYTRCRRSRARSQPRW